MKIIKSISLMQKWSQTQRKKGQVVFVPTMGCLHEGHLKLIASAQKKNACVVVSIFVNPLQFGINEDFDKYPRTLKEDIEKLKKLKVDVLFLPSAQEMYPQNFQTNLKAGSLANQLCGKFRHNHFDGVITVVNKLFMIVYPHQVYFGQKDYQQFCVIQQMVKDLSLPIKIKMVNTVREKDGLALSSRNRYLTQTERTKAPEIYATLESMQLAIQNQNKTLEQIKKEATLRLNKNFKIEYLEICDPVTLEPLHDMTQSKVLVAVAVRLGSTRLIDNILISTKKKKR